MRVPMPSPRGTNRAGLFITKNPVAAYDESIRRRRRPDAARRAVARDEKPAVSEELIEFLRTKLSLEDFDAWCMLAKIDDSNEAMDDEGGPEPFAGMPKRGGEIGEDAISARMKARIRRAVLAAPTRPRSGATPAMDAAHEADYARRYPHAAKIKVDHYLAPRPAPAPAMDAAQSKSYAERFPGAAKIKVNA
jgi:hypothetical protein